jgi:hypothetical protein
MTILINPREDANRSSYDARTILEIIGEYKVRDLEITRNERISRAQTISKSHEKTQKEAHMTYTYNIGKLDAYKVL